MEGRLKYGKYTDQSGIEKNTVDIIATELQLLGGRDGGGPGGSGAGAGSDDSGSSGFNAGAPRTQSRPPQNQAPSGAHKSGFDDMDDDIPF